MKDKLEVQMKEVLLAFPLLQRIENNLLRGFIHLTKSYYDVPIIINYKVEIYVPNDYPNKLPIAKEIGGKIDLVYSHIYSDRTLCLATDGDMKISLFPDYCLIDFINKYVISYLYSHSYFEKYKVFPFGERSHGINGVFEFYMEHFNLTTKNRVKDLLKLICMKESKGHLICYCGSNKKIRDCHIKEILKFRNSNFISIYKQDYKLINEVGNAKYIKKTKRK